VVVHAHRQDLLGLVLADDVVVEERADLARRGQLLEVQLSGLGELLLDDLVAQVDAFVADVHAGAGDHFLTCFCDLPQKLHFSSSPVSPNLATVTFPLDSARLAQRMDPCGPPRRATRSRRR
jgi:hypothetical protein